MCTLSLENVTNKRGQKKKFHPCSNMLIISHCCNLIPFILHHVPLFLSHSLCLCFSLPHSASLCVFKALGRGKCTAAPASVSSIFKWSSLLLPNLNIIGFKARGRTGCLYKGEQFVWGWYTCSLLGNIPVVVAAATSQLLHDDTAQHAEGTWIQDNWLALTAVHSVCGILGCKKFL